MKEFQKLLNSLDNQRVSTFEARLIKQEGIRAMIAFYKMNHQNHVIEFINGKFRVTELKDAPIIDLNQEKHELGK